MTYKEYIQVNSSYKLIRGRTKREILDSTISYEFSKLGIFKSKTYLKHLNTKSPNELFIGSKIFEYSFMYVEYFPNLCYNIFLGDT